jgi:hypothetical protein
VIEPARVEVIRSWSCAHVGGERRLVAHGGRDPAEERGHFGTGLREAEDVVHEEQHVGARLVAELFGERQAGERHAHAGARRLVHLAVDQRHLGFLELVDVDDARFDELVVEVVPLPRPLAHAGEHGIARVHLGDVVDQLLDEHGLAHAGAAEEADLSALRIGGEEVDDLDPGHEHFRGGRLRLERRGRLVDAAVLLRADGSLFVDGLAHDVEDPSERRVAHGHGDRAGGVGHGRAADEALGRVHGDGANRVLTEVLRDLEDEALAIVHRLERIQDRGKLAVELNVDDGPDHLRDFASSSLPWERLSGSVRAPRRPR